MQVASPQHTGVDAGRFFPFGNDADLPPDQREEDGRSVCFDSAPLARRIEILGNARVRLRLHLPRHPGAGDRPALRRRPGRLLHPGHPRRA